MEDGTLPDLRDIELKLGRKVPESLVRSLRGEELVPLERDRDPCGGSSEGGGACSSSSSSCSFPPSLSSSSSSSPTSGSPGRRSHSSTLERLETKLHLLRQEMVSVVRQLWSWGRGPKNAVIGRWGLGERVARAVGLSFRAWEMKGRGAHRGCRSGGSRCEACLPRTLLGSGFAKIAACSVCVLYDSADSVLPCSDHFVAPGPPPPGGFAVITRASGACSEPFTLSVQKVAQAIALITKILPGLPRGGAAGSLQLAWLTPLPPLRPPPLWCSSCSKATVELILHSWF